MFSSRVRNPNDQTEQYLQRISELEAALDAAHQLIVDQQQMLKSNLDASIALDSDRGDESWTSADSNELPPLRPGVCSHNSDLAPIKLPDFSVPVLDIANQVMRAANDRGGIVQPAQERTRITLPFTLSPAASDSHQRGHAQSIESDSRHNRSVKRPAAGLVHPLLVCSVVLLSSALAVIAWTQYQNTHTKSLVPIPIKYASPATHPDSPPVNHSISAPVKPKTVVKPPVIPSRTPRASAPVRRRRFVPSKVNPIRRRYSRSLYRRRRRFHIR